MRRPAALLVLCIFVAACGPASGPVVFHDAQAVPARLSEWGLVLADGRRLHLNDGVIPYELNTPLFSDYALKLRTVWMPEGTSAVYNEDRELDFPVGTIISKTFHYEKKGEFVRQQDRESELNSEGYLDLDQYVLIETRLLVRYEEGWKAYPYVWNSTQDDATLEIAGDQREITLAAGDVLSPITYIVPDANQCAGCHVTDHTS